MFGRINPKPKAEVVTRYPVRSKEYKAFNLIHEEYLSISYWE